MDYSLVKIADIAAEDEPLLQVIDVPGSSPAIRKSIAAAHLRLNDTDETTLLALYCAAARHAIEGIIHRPIGEQTWEMGLRWWYPETQVGGCRPTRIELPRAPLIALQSITYLKSGESTATVLYDATSSPVVPSALFTVDTSGEVGAIYLKNTQVWPVDILETGFPIKVRFTAGLSSIPSGLIAPMCLMLGHLWENREAVDISNRTQAVEIPLGVRNLCEQYMSSVGI